MKRRALDIVLVALLVPGAILAWRTGQRRERLEARYEHLRQVTGDLPVADPSKVYLGALRTEEPLHYAWRVYVPAGYPGGVRVYQGEGGSWSGLGTWSSTQPDDFIARVRLREGPGERLELYARLAHGSIRTSIGGSTLAEFVRAHRAEIQVEQAGAGEVAALPPDRGTTLLRVAFPEHLRAEAEQKLAPYERSCFPVLMRVEIGPETPKAQPAPSGGE